MLPVISWRNIWRNRVRSWVVIIAIILGICGGTFLMAFSWGMTNQRAQNIINTEIGHIQIHHPQFKDEQNIAYTLPNPTSLFNKLCDAPIVEAASPRIILNGMVASAQTGAGVEILGIDPTQERKVTQLSDQLIAGTYFNSDIKNPILIGERLAEKLQVKLGSKIVLTFQDQNNEIVSGAFRVVGLYKTINTKFDQSYVFVKSSDIKRMLSTEGMVHEMVIAIHSPRQISSATQTLSSTFPDLQVENWQDLAPDLTFISESFDSVMRIFLTVIMLALAFGIVNTMLMAVLERSQELGMLIAIGMNRIKIFLMIMLETLFLTLIGGFIGLAAGWALIHIFGQIGIDLSFIEASLSSLGMSSIIYTELTPSYYRDIVVAVFLTAILSSIYPAIKALQINPSEAVRAI